MKTLNKSFNFIRIFGVYGVVIYHMAEIYYPDYNMPLLLTNTVYFCFALTGFLYGYNHANNNKYSTNYGIRKYSEFWPSHFLAFLIAFGFDIFKNIYYHAPVIYPISDLPKTVLNISLLQSWVPKQDYFFSYNGASWYLSSIMLFYFVAPFLGRFVSKIKNKNTLIGIAYSLFVLIFIFVIKCYSNISGDLFVWLCYINPILNCLILFASMCFGLYINSNDIFKNVKTILTVVSLIVSVIAVSFGYTIGIVLLALSLLCLFTILPSKLFKFADNRLFDYLTSISFEFYILHQPIINIINHFVNIKIINNNVLAIILTLLLITVLAILLKKFNKTLKNKQII